jgi:WD40 repeat protein
MNSCSTIQIHSSQVGNVSDDYSESTLYYQISPYSRPRPQSTMVIHTEHLTTNHSRFTVVHGDQINQYKDDSESGTGFGLSLCHANFACLLLYAASRLLRKASMMGVAFDSHERPPMPVRLSGTQQSTRDDIKEVLSTPHGRSLCWLSGAAGSGTSAVSQSIANHFSSKKQLAASFFSPERQGNRTCIMQLFTTISYQLTISIPAAKSLILDAIQNDSSILNKFICLQLHRLIIEPLLKLKLEDIPHLPTIVVIDALDECDEKNHVYSLLIEALSKPQFPLKFLVTSRRTLSIQMPFTGEAQSITHMFFLIEPDTVHANPQSLHHCYIAMQVLRRSMPWIIIPLLVMYFIRSRNVPKPPQIWTAHSKTSSRKAVSINDGTVQVLDVSTGETVYGPFSLEGYKGQMRSIALSPDGKQIASGSSESTVGV